MTVIAPGRRILVVLMVWIAGLGLIGMYGQTVAEQYLLVAANQDRAIHRLEPLKIDTQLSLAARMHASEMARRKTISHQFYGEAELATRVGDAGVHFSLVTENVAEAPNPALIHDLWMNSEGHRANLLDPAVDAIGISVIRDRGQYYAVEDFARTVERLTLEQQESIVARMLARSGMRLLADVPDARQTCTMSNGFAGNRQPWFVMRYTSADIGRLPDELTARMATGKYHQASVGACVSGKQAPFSSYNLAVMLYP